MKITQQQYYTLTELFETEINKISEEHPKHKDDILIEISVSLIGFDTPNLSFGLDEDIDDYNQIKNKVYDAYSKCLSEL